MKLLAIALLLLTSLPAFADEAPKQFDLSAEVSVQRPAGVAWNAQYMGENCTKTRVTATTTKFTGGDIDANAVPVADPDHPTLSCWDIPKDANTPRSARCWLDLSSERKAKKPLRWYYKTWVLFGD